MFDRDLLTYVLGVMVVVAPTLLIFFLGIPTLLGHPLSERTIGKAVQAAIVVGLVASLIMLAIHKYLDLGNGDAVNKRAKKFLGELIKRRDD